MSLDDQTGACLSSALTAFFHQTNGKNQWIIVNDSNMSRAIHTTFKCKVNAYEDFLVIVVES